MPDILFTDKGAFPDACVCICVLWLVTSETACTKIYFFKQTNCIRI